MAPPNITPELLAQFDKVGRELGQALAQPTKALTEAQRDLALQVMAIRAAVLALLQAASAEDRAAIAICLRESADRFAAECETPIISELYTEECARLADRISKL